MLMEAKAVTMPFLSVATLAVANPTVAEQPTLEAALLNKLQGTCIIAGTVVGEETTEDLTVDVTIRNTSVPDNIAVIR
jgi:hypothetical protein